MRIAILSLLWLCTVIAVQGMMIRNARKKIRAIDSGFDISLSEYLSNHMRGSAIRQKVDNPEIMSILENTKAYFYVFVLAAMALFIATVFIFERVAPGFLFG